MKNHNRTVSMIMICMAAMACYAGTTGGKKEDNPQQVTTVVSSASDTASRFIVMDTANKMLGSYLNSIHYLQNDTDIQSMIIDVAQLRKYIDSMPGSSGITHLKLMFAHTLAYANGPYAGTPAGYHSNALTIIIAAYNVNGDYVFYPSNMVLDYTQPCPPICPAGAAASPFLSN